MSLLNYSFDDDTSRFTRLNNIFDSNRERKKKYKQKINLHQIETKPRNFLGLSLFCFYCWPPSWMMCKFWQKNGMKLSLMYTL